MAGAPAFVSKSKKWIPSSIRESVLRSANPAVLRARAALGHSVLSAGRLTVVVPVYNVEEFLEECLESLRVQNYPDLEVLMVNDGSTDSSAEIASRFAEADRRFRLITQENGGLGAARNTGIEAATGAFITFVDSDDIVPRDAYYRMISALRTSGSDFVIGAIDRLKGRRQWRDAWARRVHAKDRFGLHLEDLPEMTKDVFATNKVFRLDFFRQVVGRFPERIYYEDQGPTARAFTGAKSIDIISNTTYLWRIREDGSSITQNKLRLSDLIDRLTVMRDVESVFRLRGSQEIYRYWLQKTVAEDLSYYYALGPRGSDEYWNLLVTGTQEFLSKLTDEELAGMPARHRIPALLTAAGAKESLARYLGVIQDFRSGMPVLAGSSGAAPKIDFRTLGIETGVIPDHLSSLGGRDLELRVSIQQFEWLDATTVELQGYAFLPGEERGAALGSLSLELVSGEDVRPVHVEPKVLVPGSATPPPSDSFITYRENGFIATIDVQQLVDLGSGSRWGLRASLELDGIVHTNKIQSVSKAGSGALLAPTFIGSDLVEPRFNDVDGFQIAISSVPVHADRLEVQEGRRVALRLHHSGRDRGHLAIRAINREAGAVVKARADLGASGSTGVAEIDLELPRVSYADASNRPRIWTFEYREHGMWHKLPTSFQDAPSADESTDGLRLSLADTPYLKLEDHRWFFAADRFELTRDRSVLRIGGRLEAESAPRFALLSPDGTAIPVTVVSWDRGSHQAVLEVELDTRTATDSKIEVEWYGLCGVANDDEDIRTESLPIPPTQASRARNPLSLHSEALTVRVTNRGYAGSIYMHIGPAKADRWRGLEGRLDLIRQAEEIADRSALQDRKVFASSFNGTNSLDSVGPVVAAMRERGLIDEVVWAVADAQVEVSEGDRKVIEGTPEFIFEMRTARFLVNNNNFPHYFRKRDGQLYAQLWHGTPLKRIANDVPSTSLSFGYRALMEREVAAWDLLIGQSDEASGLLASAFGFAGETVTTGYPKNDPLARADTYDAMRRQTRELLGLAADELVIMYAPTWRDNVKSDSGGGYGEVRYLQEEVLLDRLGPATKILVRGHFNTRGDVRVEGNDRVINVSNFQNLNALMAAADLLVTDYSSIMFDFAVTGKPLFFLSPDLEEYSGETRGMYFDYLDTVPGTPARTTEDLARMIQERDEEAPEFKEFRRRFAPLDDGRAADRVAELLERRFREQTGRDG